MKNTRKKNVVVYIINENGDKLYYKGYSLNGIRLWTRNVNEASKKSINEAKKQIVNTLYNHIANYEIIEVNL